MTTTRSRERDPDRAREIAEHGSILRAPVGSTVHGLRFPGTDDRDEMAVCIEPPEYLLGLRQFEHFVHRTKPEGVRSGPGDLELIVYGLRKYCRLALKGSPTALLLLFVPEEHVIHRTELGAQLQAMASAFLSRRTGDAFLGYIDAHRRGLVREDHAPRTREASAEHAYDTKHAMHALRIGYQGEELLGTHRITLPVPEPARSRLMEVRRGTVPLDDVLAELDAAVARIRDLMASSGLSDEPDYDAVDRFLVEAYQQAWAREG